jgi:hypothetical protein
MAKKAAKSRTSIKAPALQLACHEFGSRDNSWAVEAVAARAALVPKRKRKRKRKRKNARRAGSVLI